MLSSNQAMFVAWGPGRTLLYNDAYAEILAGKHPEALGRDFLEVWGEIRDDLVPIVEEAYAGRPVHMDDIELIMERRGHKEEAHFAFSYTPVRNEDGAVGGFFCACLETTQTVLVQRRGIAERERLERMFEQAPGFMAMLQGPEHRFELTNPSYQRLIGHREVMGKSVAEALPEAAAQGYVNLLDQVYRTGEALASHGASFAVQTEPGGRVDERILDFVYQPVRDVNGAVEGIFVEGQDVTERVRAETALHAREAELAAEAAAMRHLQSVGALLVQEDSVEAIYECILDAAAEIMGADCASIQMLDPIRQDLKLIASRCFHPQSADFWEWVDAGSGSTCGISLVTGDRVVVGDVEDCTFMAGTADLDAYRRSGIRAVQSTPLRSRAGVPVGMISTHWRDPHTPDERRLRSLDLLARQASDVIERAAALAALRDNEARLRESEARYRQIVEGAEDFAIVTLDKDGIITGWNSGAERVTGFAAADAIGRLGEIFFTPEDRAEGAPDHEMSQARKDGRAADERWHQRQDGTRFWGSGLMMRLPGERGGYLKIFRDRTPEHEADARLRASEARLQVERSFLAEVLAKAPVGFSIVDGEGRVTMLNDRGTQLLGQSFEAAAPHEFAKYGGVHADGRPYEPEDYPTLRAARGERIERERLIYLRGGPAGTERIVLEVDAMPIRDANGHLAGAVTVFEDAGLREQAERELQRRVATAVAELEVAQEALRQSQKLESMGQLTGGVAHDFNNLLTPIVGALDMLQRKGLGGEREQRLIAGAAQSAERAKTLVQRLLAFARRQPLQPIAVDIAKLVTGMADLVRSTSGPQIEVVVEVAEGLASAKADPNQLEMALLNLSVNARDAMPDGGTLRITATEERADTDLSTTLRAGRYIRLSVADSGVGMDEATRGRAIEPFFSTKGVGKGTGLGLSMAHGLASQLGGALTIQSRTGVGTNVELWLPVTSASVEGAGPGAKVQMPMSAAGTALLVDDEELVRISTADMLVDLGYVVVEAGSAEEALDLIRDGLRPGVLVTDHLMSGMNGTDLAHAVRLEQPGVQILLVSGYAENEGVAPDLPRLTKPFRKDELAASLASLRIASV
jgi:PAS domain S-box-containing protein